MKFSRRDFLKFAGALSLTPLVRSASQAAGFHLPSAQGAPPNILVLVLDALSARNMSLHGYARQTTPWLEKFAQTATVYHRHHAGGSFTTPGTASLLTGVYPWMHRAFNFYGTPAPFFVDHNLFSALVGLYHSFFYTHNPLVYKLAYPLRRQIETFLPISAWCLDSNSPTQQWFQQDFEAASEAEAFLFRSEDSLSGSLFLSALNRKFQHGFHSPELNQSYQGQFPDGLPASPIAVFTLEDTFSRLFDHLRSQPTPFLGYVHVLPPHDPYNTNARFKGRLQDDWKAPQKPLHALAQDDFPLDGMAVLRRKYDEFILYTDAEFGRLYQQLEQQGFLENTCLVVTSDHGEMFERGIWSHITPTLYEPLLQIPLLIHYPGQRQRQDVDLPTSAVDLLPTLLQVAGAPAPTWSEGLPLQGLEFQPDALERSIFAVEAKTNPKHAPLKTATLVLVRGQYKLIGYFGYDRMADKVELYHLGQDPEEMTDLVALEPAVAVSMKDELQARLEQAEQALPG